MVLWSWERMRAECRSLIHRGQWDASIVVTYWWYSRVELVEDSDEPHE